jgi:hypothetical protein
MKSFFLGTYNFWIVTRIIFCVALFVSLVGIFQEAQLNQLELIVNLIAVVYWIMLLLIILRQLSGASRMRSISSVVGVISMLIGIVLLLLPFMIKAISLFAILLFSIWMLALGLFDLLGIQRPSPLDEEM